MELTNDIHDKGILMEIFEHNFDAKTFRLTIRVNQFNCLMGFEIFDKDNVYLNVKGLPVYKNRLLEFIENLKAPEPTNEISTLNFLPPFNFGHQNKSYLLFNIQMIMNQGTLMGCLYERENSKANHFTVTAISGKRLSEFIENNLSSNIS